MSANIVNIKYLYQKQNDSYIFGQIEGCARMEYVGTATAAIAQ